MLPVPKYADPVKRVARYAIEGLTVTNNLARHNDYGVIGEGAGIGTPALDLLAPGWVWTHNVLAGENGNSYPPITWKPTLADYRAQFAGDLTLLPGSSYVTQDTAGGALGATVTLPGGIAYQPPVVPPPNPCETDPFRPTVSKWPASQTRSASGTWNPNGKRVVSAQFLWNPQRFVAEDARGCTHTVAR